MSSCEKCWSDAHGDAERYHELVKSRECTPEEQAGEQAFRCPHCRRLTIHMITKEPMCGCYEPSDAGEHGN